VKTKLVIDLASLPEDGKEFAGELDPAIYGLAEGDAVPIGPLLYDLLARRFGNELLLTGSLESTFEFTCVRSLHPFTQTIVVADAAIALEIGQYVEIDATEALREEVLINFPANPRCEEGDEPMECEIDPRYFVVDKSAGEALGCPPRAEGDDRWSALDKIKDLKDQPQPE
jgi:uncharacterized protein